MEGFENGGHKPQREAQWDAHFACKYRREENIRNTVQSFNCVLDFITSYFGESYILPLLGTLWG